MDTAALPVGSAPKSALDEAAGAVRYDPCASVRELLDAPSRFDEKLTPAELVTVYAPTPSVDVPEKNKAVSVGPRPSAEVGAHGRNIDTGTAPDAHTALVATVALGTSEYLPYGSGATMMALTSADVSERLYTRTSSREPTKADPPSVPDAPLQPSHTEPDPSEGSVPVTVAVDDRAPSTYVLVAVAAPSP